MESALATVYSPLTRRNVNWGVYAPYSSTAPPWSFRFDDKLNYIWKYSEKQNMQRGEIGEPKFPMSDSEGEVEL